jgi:uncharacterized membrane-anchored protein YhcB (DUF1043 family)
MAGKQAVEAEPVERDWTKEESQADEMKSARQILYDIGNKFTELLKKNSRAQAYQYLQKHLMKNMDRLVPNIIPLKDFIATITDLEEYLKGSLGTGTKPPIDVLADWLQGKELK